MRLGTRTNFTAEEVCRVPRPGKDQDIKIRIRAISPTFSERFMRDVPAPKVTELCPRLGVARDEKGATLKRDGVPIWEYDLEVPAFVAAQQKHTMLQLAAQVYEAIKDCNPDLEFDNKPDQHPNKASFYDAILTEMDKAGWSGGDIILVATAVGELSNISNEKIEEARRGFLLDLKVNQPTSEAIH